MRGKDTEEYPAKPQKRGKLAQRRRKRSGQKAKEDLQRRRKEEDEEKPGKTENGLTRPSKGHIQPVEWEGKAEGRNAQRRRKMASTR